CGCERSAARAAAAAGERDGFPSCAGFIGTGQVAVAEKRSGGVDFFAVGRVAFPLGGFPFPHGGLVFPRGVGAFRAGGWAFPRGAGAFPHGGRRSHAGPERSRRGGGAFPREGRAFPRSSARWLLRDSANAGPFLRVLEGARGTGVRSSV